MSHSTLRYGEQTLGTKVPNQAHKDIEYFVSFCVMTEGANPMGHSFMIVSQLDHSQGNKARMEIINAIGVYSRYMPVLGFKPYAVANIKLEDMRYIAGVKGLAHETYRVTAQDVGKVLDVFYQDKLKIAQHDATERSQEKQKPLAVPMFNVFTKQNCKKYVLDAMNKIGINTSHLSSFMEIPILNSLDIMRISEEENSANDKTYYWLSPMRYKAKQECLASNEPLQQYYVDLYQLYSRSHKLLSIIAERQDELKNLGKTVQEVNNIEKDLRAISMDIEKVAAYPKLITNEQVTKLARKLTRCIDKHISDLEAKQIESGLINVLKDVLREVFLYCKQLIVSDNKRNDATFNTMDKEVFDKIRVMDAQMRDNKHASDVLPNHTYRRARV